MTTPDRDAGAADPAADTSRNSFGRRAALAAALAGIAGGGAVLASAGSPSAPKDATARARTRNILSRLIELPPDSAVFLALDTPPGRATAMTALQSLSRAIDAADSSLEVGLALGATYFQSAGLLNRAPRQLVEMPSFPGDLLQDDQSHGEVLIHVGARTDHEAQAGAQHLLAAVPHWTVRWRVNAFRSDNRIEAGRALTRNRFGYTEGLGNPARAEDAAAQALVRHGDDEPAWAVGGSYQVVRHIRFATQLWAKDSPEEQDRIIGRHRDGRWLDGTPADESPDFTADPRGRLIPLDSHVRLANPRTRRNSAPPLVRRSYSYVRKVSDAESSDKGLVFTCYQRSLEDGFIPVQRRLAAGAMNTYVLTTGGGYYFVPPVDDVWVQRLFA